MFIFESAFLLSNKTSDYLDDEFVKRTITDTFDNENDNVQIRYFILRMAL